MSQETAVHRWDAQAAAGTGAAGGFDPAFAADGVDELVDVFLRMGPSWFPERTLGGSLRLACSDVGADWVVSFGDGSYSLTRGAGGEADAAVRGPASDLLLFAWNRPVAPGAVETTGDEAVLAAWRALAI